MIFKSKFLIFLLIGLLGSFYIQAADITSGKVYRFKNVGKPGNNLAMAGSGTGAVGTAANNADLKQQWYVIANENNTGYYMRNVSNGAYLESATALYTQWPMVFTSTPNANMVMSFPDYEGNVLIKRAAAGDGNVYAHNDGSNSIVCWAKTSTPTQWTVEEVPMTSQQIEDMLRRFNSTGDEISKAATYESHLSNLFADKACTTLKVTGDLSNNSDYLALPPTLRQMVDKIQKNDWLESSSTGEWIDKYARKYRVQLYEPYSEGSAAASFAGIQAYTNMNNPTGIIANEGDMLYIMVEEEPKDGSTLYIGAVPDCSMYNSVTSGTRLKKGLNMIMCSSNLTHYFIYYTVNTVSGKQRVRKVTDYDPITIHIEGGQLNGFFNYVGDELYTPDKEEDYRYTIALAQHPMYDMLGNYVILHFFKDDTPDLPSETTLQLGVKSVLDPARNPGPTKHYDPAVIMKAWDDMCFAERILMGLQPDSDIADPFNQGMYSSIINDNLSHGGYSINLREPYSDYFNNRMMGITLQAQGLYMNATSWRTAYAPSTVSAILSQFPQDGIWGPAHEYGHMNQTPMRIAGTTEVSNNVFSNVANYFVCKTTSRCDYPSAQLKIFNEGKTYLENGTWGTTRMYWQLWCYYHATKHNTKFYPRLYELLRNYPLKRDLTTIPGKLNPKTDLLHFAKMCCIAAEEDLTNFFTSWGFFVPQDNYHIDDYDIYDCILTQEDIDEVKNEIKSYNFPKNDAIILIDDRPGSDLTTGFGYNKELCGQYGGLKDFENPQAGSGDFTFTVDGTNVTVSGNGNPGVGFLIYDNDGNLIGFSNSNSFTLSSEAASDLIAGNAVVKAVDANNNVIEVADPIRSGDLQTRKDLLSTLISRADALLALADETECHVGGLFVDSCKELKEIRDEKNEFLSKAGNSDLEELTNAYLELSDVYYALLNDPSARIPIVPGSAYRMINHQYTDRALDAGTDKCVATIVNPSSNSVAFSQQWVLEPVEGNANTYYIKNLADGRYIGTSKKQSTPVPLGETPQAYALNVISPGVYAFAPDNELRFGIHVDASRNVVQWNTTSTPTQWTLVKTSTPEIITLRKELGEKLEAARQTLATCGTNDRKAPKEYVFAEEDLTTNAKYNGGGSDQFRSWSVLFDNNIDTYFHSRYNGDSDDGKDHYIRMKAPGNDTFRFFELGYTTRNISNTGTNPRSFILESSTDGETWKEIYHTSGLPTGQAVEYTTGEIIAPENSRYIKMIVTGSGGSSNGHPYFVLSELNVTDLGEPVFTPDENFPYLTAEEMAALYDAIIDSSLDLADSSTSLQALQERSNALEAAIKTVSDVMIPKVEVNSVSFAVDQVVVKMNSGPATVTLTVDPEEATFPEFEWVIEDETIARIAKTDGKTVIIEPVAMGETTLNVKVAGNPLANASCSLKVLPEVPVEAVAIVPAEMSLPLNAGDFTLSYEIYPENATVKDVRWSSSDPSIADIDPATGLLSLERPGSCEIYATSTDGTDITGKCSFTVSNAVAEGLILYPEALTLQKGEEFTMSYLYVPAEADQPIVEWTTSDPAVASVDPSGNVLALTEGQTEISIKSNVNGHELESKATVTVIPVVVKGVALSEIAITLEKGMTKEIAASFTPSNSFANLDWSVSNPEVASIEENAIGDKVIVTALKPGMTTLTANLPDNDLICATCIITVPEMSVERIEFVNTEFSLDVADGSSIYTVKFYPEEAPTPRLIWETNDTDILSLNPTAPLECEITPLQSGKAVVTVSHADMPDIFVSKEFDVTFTSGIANLFADKQTPVDVFEMNGKIVKLKVEVKDLNNLSPGIYIIRQGNVSKEVIVR